MVGKKEDIKRQADKELKKAKKLKISEKVRKKALGKVKPLESKEKDLLDINELKKDDAEFQKRAKSAGKKLLAKNIWYLKKKNKKKR